MKCKINPYLVFQPSAYYFFIFWVLLSGCSSDIRKNDLKEMSLNGRVKLITEVFYDAKENNGTIVKGEIQKSNSTLFDKQGKIIEENSYTSDGSLSSKTECQYNDKGNLTEGDGYGPSGNLYSKATYEYNDKGKITEQNCYNENASSYSITKITYQYDELGYNIEKDEYRLDGTVQVYKYKYDFDGNEVEDKYNYLSDGRHNGCSKQYNNKGWLTEEQEYDLNGNYVSQTFYQYNEQGNLTEAYSTELDTSSYTYHKFHSYRYDDMNNLTEETSYNLDSSIRWRSNCQYEYDIHNNWIKNIQHTTSMQPNAEDSSTVSSITERSIDYYWW